MFAKKDSLPLDKQTEVFYMLVAERMEITEIKQ